jgi:hypothetical protein
LSDISLDSGNVAAVFNMISLSEASGGDASSVNFESNRQSSPPDEPNLPAKRHALLPPEIDDASNRALSVCIDTDFSGGHTVPPISVSVQDAKQAKLSQRQALVQRKRLLERELQHLEASGSLLDFVESESVCSEAPSPPPIPTVSEEPQASRGAVGRKGFERWHGEFLKHAAHKIVVCDRLMY